MRLIIRVIETLIDLLPLETIETMTEVQVEELCTRTVKRIPIIRPTTGLLSSTFPRNIEPKRNVSHSNLFETNESETPQQKLFSDLF